MASETLWLVSFDKEKPHKKRKEILPARNVAKNKLITNISVSGIFLVFLFFTHFFLLFSSFLSFGLTFGHDAAAEKKTANKNAAACSSWSSSSFRINDKLFETQKLKFVEGENNLFNVSVSGSIPKEELESPTTIECFLTVPETNYTKKRSTIYYGKSAPKPPRSTTQPTQPFQTSPERKPNAKLVIVNEFFSSSCCAFVVLLAFFSPSLVFHGKLIVCMCGCAFSYFI